MYYTTDSPVIVSEDSSILSENNNKSFDNIHSDLYDLESESSYHDLFSSNMEDQAVPDFLDLNTPAVTSCSNGYTQMTDSVYMSRMMNNINTPEDSYLTMQPPSYYSHESMYQSPAIPSHVPVSSMGNTTDMRGPVIMGSATTTPEQKPRRKGGRKPKNDPLPPHLEERRRLRRIRNKEAAQKCRERRLAQTNTLLAEIDQLERQTREFEMYINKLRETKEQCEYILNSHQSTCVVNNQRSVIPTTTSAAYHPYAMPATCSAAHRRSSSNSESELLSPHFVL